MRWPAYRPPPCPVHPGMLGLYLKGVSRNGPVYQVPNTPEYVEIERRAQHVGPWRLVDEHGDTVAEGD